MAARRLLAAMLVFLAISTVLAALAPRQIEPDDERPTRKTTTTVPKSTPVHGDLVRRQVHLERANGTLRARPGVIGIDTGDQLALTVSTPRVVTLDLASLGITETAGPDGPARFDLFLNAPGRHTIRDTLSGRRLFRIEVENRPRKPTPNRPAAVGGRG